MLSRVLVSLAAVFVLCIPARSASNYFYFASQYDWTTAHGFFLDLESVAPDGTAGTLSGARMVLGVGDGQQWRYLFAPQAWEYDRDYTARIVLNPQYVELWLDGSRLGRSNGGFAPQSAPLDGNQMPYWAAGPTQYMVAMNSLSATSSTGAALDWSFAEENARSLPMWLFAPQASRRGDWPIRSGETHTFTITFRFMRTPNPRDYDPHVDRFGQARHATWPGKVTAEGDLQGAIAEESVRHQAWGQPGGYDSFGGLKTAGWSEAATGFYRLSKRNGYWWLITPDGYPCFYRGVCTAPALSWEMTPTTGRASIFAELPSRSAPWSAGWAHDVWGAGDGADYVAFHTANLIRKYGSAWSATATETAINRIKTWGFAGFAKWSNDTGRLPWIPVIYITGVPRLVRHPDVFNPSVRAGIKTSLASQMSGRIYDSWILGWSVGSEWDEIVTLDETQSMLKLGPTVPAKRAMIDHALQSLYGGSVTAMASAWGVGTTTVDGLYASAATPPASDLEALRRFFADAYYGCIYQTVKSIDPYHLYLGNWIVPGWWQNEEDWKLIARHCDVIGYDHYNFRFTTPQLARLIRETGKPILNGEFSFPPTYRMQRGFGVYPNVYAVDDAAAGDAYRDWINQATSNPYCVGVCWFEYRDQAITGRGPGSGPDLVYGERYAFGLVDMTDRPKWDLVERMRTANLGATTARVTAMNTRTPMGLTRRALRAAAGLNPVTEQDLHDLEMDGSGPSVGRIDLRDAAALAARGL